ncbi:MAG TPA: AcvB/VirJ family lysyl-phosphatidylglycerol hydrolase, partial [Gammaproteobacteria bacterium]|nr:AcvB/VirJ family lysyl-phosphatidylglycerol hydrolase [Gammaproteobacteria bacterium]
MDGRRLIFALLAALSLLAAGTGPAVHAADKLPLMLVEAPPGTDGPMMLLLTGDGNWAAFPHGIAEASARHGAPVLALLSRDYMAKVQPVTPERLAADLAGAVRTQLEAWHKTDIVVVGYSRGADWTPFVLNRWPAELRSRVKAIVFVGLSNTASFEFHFEDLFRDVARPTDVPVAPEVAKLEGIPMTCVHGA